MNTRVSAIKPRKRPRHQPSSRSRKDGTEHRVRVQATSSPPCPFRNCSRPWSPPRPRKSSAPLTICTTATLSPSHLSCRRKYSFPDNWIYVHAKEVQVGRIQNFGSWSPYLVKEGRTCLGLEFFVFEGDKTWNKPDAELIEQGKRELEILGLVTADKVEAGFVVRMPKAYPFYDQNYKANVARIVEWMKSAVPNVHPVGRNGMHRYNNQDHSMYTAMLTAENIATGSSTHDVWSVNVEEVYHETEVKRRARVQERAAAQAPVATPPSSAVPISPPTTRSTSGRRRARVPSFQVALTAIPRGWPSYSEDGPGRTASTALQPPLEILQLQPPLQLRQRHPKTRLLHLPLQPLVLSPSQHQSSSSAVPSICAKKSFRFASTSSSKTSGSRRSAGQTNTP